MNDAAMELLPWPQISPTGRLAFNGSRFVDNWPPFDQTRVASLAEYCSDHSTEIKSMSFDQCIFLSGIDFAPLFQACREVNHLTLNANEFQEDGLGYLLRSACLCKTIKRIEIYSMPIPKASMDLLVGALADSSVEELQLVHNQQMNNDSFAALCCALKTNTTIKRLVASIQHEVTDWTPVGGLLSTNSVLEDLFLGMNDTLDNAALDSLCQAIKTHKTLKVLHLNRNPSLTSIAPLIEILQDNSTLEYLDLSWCEGLANADFEQICQALHHNRTLRRLDFESEDDFLYAPLRHALVAGCLLEDCTTAMLSLLSDFEQRAIRNDCDRMLARNKRVRRALESLPALISSRMSGAHIACLLLASSRESSLSLRYCIFKNTASTWVNWLRDERSSGDGMGAGRSEKKRRIS